MVRFAKSQRPYSPRFYRGVGNHSDNPRPAEAISPGRTGGCRCPLERRIKKPSLDCSRLGFDFFSNQPPKRSVALGSRGFGSSRSFRSGRSSFGGRSSYFTFATARSGSGFTTARGGSFATAGRSSGFATTAGLAGRGGRFAAGDGGTAVSLVTLLGTETGKQPTAMLLVLATADGLAADRGSRFAAGGLAALAAEEARVGLLIFTDHCETNQGHQDGDRRQNDTIHLKLLPREAEQKQSHNSDRRNCSLPCAASTVGCGWVNTIYG